MSQRSGVVLWAGLAALLGLRVVAGLDPASRLWGLAPHRFLGPVVGWSLLGLVGLCLLPFVARHLLRAAERAGEFATGSRRAYWSAALLGAALVWLMFDRVWFTGDFLLRQGYLESGGFTSQFDVALPLDRFLHGSLLGSFVSGSDWTANLAARALGGLEAGAFAALAVGFARATGLDGVAAAAAVSGVFFGGYLTMFTGLGKPASEMCVLVAAVAVFGLQVVRGRRRLLALGLTIAAAFLIHRSCVMLLPAWIFAVVGWMRRPSPGRPERGAEAWAAVGIPLVAVALMTPSILSIAREYDVPRHVVNAEVARRGWAAASLDPPRLAGLGNLVLALTPLAVLGPVLLLVRRDEGKEAGALRFLLVLALGFVPALVLVHPQHGYFKDWDVLAPAAVAWAALGSWITSRVIKVSGRSWLAVALIASAAVPAFQWLALNRHLESGLARLAAHADHAALATQEERALLWDFLAARNFRLGRWPEAAEAAARAAERAPHRRMLLMWALAETMKQDYAGAQRIYRRMLERDPEDPLALIGLAGTARRLGDSVEVKRALVRVLEGPSQRTDQVRRYLRYYPQVWPADSAEWSP